MEKLRPRIEQYIELQGRGWAFTRKDFQDIASTGPIGVIISRLANQGIIRRLGRGLFDYPKVNPALGGELSPDMDQVAQAIARKFRWTIMPDGALAANQLGLSQQVPAKQVYLSDGPTKQIQANNRSIYFKHARPKEMRTGNYSSGLIIQALRYLGKTQVDRNIIDGLRSRLSSSEKQHLLDDTRYGTDWIYEVARQIGGNG